MTSNLKNVPIRDPQETKLAFVLLLDTSKSMEGSPIQALNEGLQKSLKEALSGDDIVEKCVEISIITFGGKPDNPEVPEVRVVHDFCSVSDFNPTQLEANGNTPMGEAILLAIDHVENRKKIYKKENIEYHRPWIFMITDGEPTDMVEGDERWKEVIQRVHNGEDKNKFLFRVIAVEGANTKVLSKIKHPERKLFNLTGLNFAKLFEYVGPSVGAIPDLKEGNIKAEEEVLVQDGKGFKIN